MITNALSGHYSRTELINWSNHVWSEVTVPGEALALIVLNCCCFCDSTASAEHSQLLSLTVDLEGLTASSASYEFIHGLSIDVFLSPCMKLLSVCEHCIVEIVFLRWRREHVPAIRLLRNRPAAYLALGNFL